MLPASRGVSFLQNSANSLFPVTILENSYAIRISRLNATFKKIENWAFRHTHEHNHAKVHQLLREMVLVLSTLVILASVIGAVIAMNWGFVHLLLGTLGALYPSAGAVAHDISRGIALLLALGLTGFGYWKWFKRIRKLAYENPKG